MSFSISLSGLNAASSDLSVTSNNIANVGTTGFKGSRAEFADIFAVTPLGSTGKAIGDGVLLSNVSQQFSQGNLEFTENTLDMAITGEGFFVVRELGTNDLIYSRAGAFNVNENGLIANSANQVLQVFPVDALGNVSTTSLSGTVPLTVPNTVGQPQATTTVNININFPSDITPALTTAALDAELQLNPGNPDPTTYHQATSATVFDSQGNSHILTMYFVMTNDLNNTWETRATIDGRLVDAPGFAAGPPYVAGAQVLDFNSSGTLDVLDADADGTTTTGDGAIAYAPFTLTNGAAPLGITIDYRNTGNTITQEAQGGFSVQSLQQDGFSTGRLSGLEIDDEGLVSANFTNGQTTALGKIALARFDNPQGLNQIGNTSWVETVSSGQAVSGEAGTGNFGLIQAGALETSNVDLTAQLVKLITAQRNFQANSKAIETANTITQTIINIR
ncbi:MAG: flagellar hook protein FlgE [Gammaproteobacteria bacterium]|nr:flagellar hook protein FlgE [Gammaproteobacteria bacterium]